MIYFFTEAGGSIGLGHLSRCCALYDECLSRGLSPVLVVNAQMDTSDVLGHRKVISIDWRSHEFLRTRLCAGDCAVIDSYIARKEYYDTIASVCRKTVYIDDTMRLAYPKGTVVNPSLYGDKLPYQQTEGVTCLGGADYVILRPAFCRPVEREISYGIRNILITMGGSDVLKLTGPVLSAVCRSFPAADKHVVMGAAVGNAEEIQAAADGSTKIHISLDAPQMRDLMLAADIAVTAAGQTIYELLRCGTPMVPVMTADNQRWNIEGLKNLGIAHVNALEAGFDASSLDWSRLFESAPRIEPFVFEGQQKIADMLESTPPLN